MDALLQQYLEKLIKEHKKLDSRGVMQVTRFIELDLTDVFIPLLLRRDKEIGLARSGLGLREASVRPGLYRQAQIAFDFDAGLADKDLELADLFKRNRHWAILGDPGSGKTTLLKHHVLETARAYLNGSSDRLPIYITLRYFAEVWLNKNPSWLPENALLAYLVEDGLKELGFADFNERQQLAAQIRSAAERGKLLLLLDGMDEERDRESKRKTGLAAASLLRLHADNRCLVSSRIIGFDAAALADHFETATIQNFSPEQRNTYLRQWLLAVEKAEDIVADQATADRAKRKADELINRLDAVSGLAALAANPLLCTIIGLIYHQGGALPHQRVELYKLCVDTFIFNWEMTKRRQGLGTEAGLNPEETQAVLEPIALYFQQYCPGNRASRQQILHIMTDFLSKETGLGAAQAERKASEQLDLIRDVAGLFIDRGEEEYGFFHLTFQEYLAARAITRKRREIERHVYTHAFDPRWREVLKLAAAHQGWKSAEDGSEFIETVLSVPHQHNQQMEYSFRLAFACMREARVEAETQQKMVARWIKLYLDQPRVRDLLLNLTARLGRELQVHQETLYPLHQALIDKDVNLRLAAISALGNFTSSPDAFDWLLNTVADEDAKVRRQAISSLNYFPPSNKTLEAYLKAIRDIEPEVRGLVAWFLARFAPSPQALDALLNAFADADQNLRQNVTIILGHFAPNSSALEALLEAITDDDKWVRHHSIRSLQRFAPNPEAFKALLKNLAVDEWHTGSVTEILGEFIPDANGLLKFLADSDDQVRYGTAKALASFAPSTTVLDLLLNILAVSNPKIRQGAIFALGSFAPNPEVLRALLSSATDQDLEVRRTTISALRNFAPSAEALEILLKAVFDSDLELRERAVSALGLFAPAPKALEALLTTLEDGIVEIRRQSVWALGNFSPDTIALEALLKTLDDGNMEIRRQSVWALSNFSPNTKALEAILKVSCDTDVDLRQELPWALGRFAPSPVALEALLKAAVDVDSLVRQRAISALGDFAPAPEALEALIEAIADRDELTRWNAIESLGNFTNNPQALDTLLTIKEDEVSFFRISWVLEKFELGHESLNSLLKALAHHDSNIRLWAAKSISEFRHSPEIINTLLKTLTDPQASIGATEALERIEMGTPL